MTTAITTPKSLETFVYNDVTIEVTEQLQRAHSASPSPVAYGPTGPICAVWHCARVRGRVALPGAPDLSDAEQVAGAMKAIRDRLTTPNSPVHHACDGRDLIPRSSGGVARPQLLRMTKLPGSFVEVEFDLEVEVLPSGAPAGPDLAQALGKRLQVLRAELVQAEAAGDGRVPTLRAIIAEFEALQLGVA